MSRERSGVLTWTAQDVVPMAGHRCQHGIEIDRAIAGDQGSRLRSGCSLAEKEDDLRRALGLQLDKGLQRAAGVEAGAS